mgnify:CR=1 FL=1
MNYRTDTDEQYYERLRNEICSMKLQEPSYEEYRWSQENYLKYVEHIKDEKHDRRNQICKLFFLAENGNVLQNDFLIAAVISYKKSGFLSRATIERLLSYENAVFKVDVMEETKPSSCIFRKKVFDLVQAATERNDIELLAILSNKVEP